MAWRIDGYKKTIGVRDVSFANTVSFYEPDGYILITNSQLTRDLTELLEKYRGKDDFYVDWWNKEELEERLRRNPHILSKYEAIVSYLG